jgi:16S rRNA processing protein RimM
MRSNHGTQSPSFIPEGYLWLGQIGRPHGVRGAFFLKTEDNRNEWPGYKNVLIKSMHGEQLHAVEKFYVSGGKLAIQLAGIESRESCENLYNSHIFVARSDIAKEADEYIVGELVGCKVQVEGRSGIFGEVVAIHNFGAQETLEIQRTGSEETVYYPFIDDFIINVDESLKTITVKDEAVFLDGDVS